MRTTMHQLELLCTRINKLTNSPLTYSDSKPGEPFKANIGHYHLNADHYGQRLVLTCNEGGGIHVIVYGTTKRDLFEKLHAFIEGLTTEKRA